MLSTYSFWSSSISTFFWHPVVGFAMLSWETKQHQKSQLYNFQTPRTNSWTFKPLYYIPRWSPLLRKRVAQTLLKDPKEGKWLPPVSLFHILVPEDSRTVLHFLLHTYPTSDMRLPRGNPIILSISNTIIRRKANHMHIVMHKSTPKKIQTLIPDRVKTATPNSRREETSDTIPKNNNPGS